MVVADHRPTPKSQRNRTKHPLAHVLIVGTSVEVAEGGRTFLKDPEILDVTCQANPDPEVSPGIRCSKKIG